MTLRVSDVRSRSRREGFLFFARVCSSALLFPTVAAAADPTSLACIRAAEDGQAARDRGALLHARELFARCAARECPDVLRRDCTGWLEEAHKQTPSVVVQARDAHGRDVLHAKAIVDLVPRQSQLDGTAIELDPGPHVVRVEAAGSEPVETRVVLAAGEKNRSILVAVASEQTASPSHEAPEAGPNDGPNTEAALQPPSRQIPRKHGLPFAAYLFGGVGVAALGVFGYFGIRGMLDADHLRETCVPGCQTADVNAVRSKLVVADVALGVGLVSLAAATWLTVRALTAPGHAGSKRRGAPCLGDANGGVILRF
jgi:hypothetical protein